MKVCREDRALDSKTVRQSLQLHQALANLDRFDLLILDDISYVRKDQDETSVLFELIAELRTAQHPHHGQPTVLRLEQRVRRRQHDGGRDRPPGPPLDDLRAAQGRELPGQGWYGREGQATYSSSIPDFLTTAAVSARRSTLRRLEPLRAGRLTVCCAGVNGVVLDLRGNGPEELDALYVDRFALCWNPSSASPARACSSTISGIRGHRGIAKRGRRPMS